MSTDKKVLNNIFDKIQEGSTKGSERYKNLVHFALLILSMAENFGFAQSITLLLK